MRINSLILAVILLFAVQATAANQLPTDRQVKAAQQKAAGTMQRFDPAKVAVPSMPWMLDPAFGGPDIQAIVDNYAKMAPNLQQAQAESRLLIFASFSMPTASLQRLIKEAGKVGAPVLLRGLVNGPDGNPSFKATVEAAGKLGLTGNEGFQIDPEVFKKHGVRTIPAFVFTGKKQTASVSGDVSLGYALEYLVNQHRALQSEIEPLWKRLQP